MVQSSTSFSLAACLSECLEEDWCQGMTFIANLQCYHDSCWLAYECDGFDVTDACSETDNGTYVTYRKLAQTTLSTTTSTTTLPSFMILHEPDTWGEYCSGEYVESSTSNSSEACLAECLDEKWCQGMTFVDDLLCNPDSCWLSYECVAFVVTDQCSKDDPGSFVTYVKVAYTSTSTTTTTTSIAMVLYNSTWGTYCGGTSIFQGRLSLEDCIQTCLDDPSCATGLKD